MTNEFSHRALDLNKDKPLVFAAMSKHSFYFRAHISKYILEHAGVPLNPFMTFDYFLLDSVDRDLVREGNNNLLKRSDVLWVFGPIADGVLAEIKIAKEMDKEIRYFKIEKSKSIIEVKKDEVEMEDEVKAFIKEL